jgi:nitrate reductase / nitrite oxidoreductase, beta subunit
MKIKAQFAMVMNLDKCIGCHTCSIPCKNVWTSRSGAEYIWYNNVETKPGIGYPKKWENQELNRGGWTIKNGKLSLKAGGRLGKLINIFHNPDLPSLEEYYEPWTYDYEKLTSSPARRHQPAVRPRSQITGRSMRIEWGPNWEDDLAGVVDTGPGDVNFRDLNYKVYLQYKNVFMFYLPRLCEHCLNPACVASCPSGALYKREEDGIVLVDQERCRGWRYCVSGCPYKKVYFNWKSGRSEKCIFCFPRVEAGLPTLCAESCVGRIRYVGLLLYDADRIQSVASTENEQGLYPAHLEVILDPRDAEIQEAALKSGLPERFIRAAVNSPVYKLAKEWKLAFPLHPEFRTLPMVWYIPPLSPLLNGSESGGKREVVLDSMRIPLKYLANLLTAGDETPVRLALERLMALRSFMRSVRVDQSPDLGRLETAGLTKERAEEMVHLLAIAKYKDRYVIPTGQKELTGDLQHIKPYAGYPSEERP